jgi:hypothetical protein
MPATGALTVAVRVVSLNRHRARHGGLFRSRDRLTLREPGRVEERLHDPLVRIDDNVAMIWASYVFVIEGKVDHCVTLKAAADREVSSSGTSERGGSARGSRGRGSSLGLKILEGRLSWMQ